MYVDSGTGNLTIDLDGPEGNAFCLLGYARKYANQLDKDATSICDEMMNGDYNQLLAVFEREFGAVIDFVNKPDDFESAGEEEDDYAASEAQRIEEQGGW